MYISAQCGEDFSYVALLVNLNAYILSTESFLVITLKNQLLYEFMILPDFCQFDVKNEPAGFRPDLTGREKSKTVPSLAFVEHIYFSLNI
jgi:hypothetical protein